MNEAELLFSETLGCQRADLYLNKGRVLAPEQSRFIASALKRRAKGEPLQYILGKTEFMGLEFRVTPDVLIPRPETELLVEKTIEVASGIRGQGSGVRILDLGTGTGCIAVSLAKYLANVEVTTVDISLKAIELARYNAALNKVAEKIKFSLGNLFTTYDLQLKTVEKPLISSLRGGRRDSSPVIARHRRCRSNLKTGSEQAAQSQNWDCFALRARNDRVFQYSQLTTYDLIVSNPPYIPSGEIDGLQPEIQYEPRAALDGGRDGLKFYRRIFSEAPQFLKRGGFLILEMGAGQCWAIKKLCNDAKNFEIIEAVKDYNNIERVLVLKKYGQTDY